MDESAPLLSGRFRISRKVGIKNQFNNNIKYFSYLIDDFQFRLYTSSIRINNCFKSFYFLINYYKQMYMVLMNRGGENVNTDIALIPSDVKKRNNYFRKDIERVIKLYGVSNSFVARKMDMKPQNLSGWKSGRFDFSWDKLRQLEEILDGYSK